MEVIIIWTRKSFKKLQNTISFKIFKIPSNEWLQLVWNLTRFYFMKYLNKYGL